MGVLTGGLVCSEELCLARGERTLGLLGDTIGVTNCLTGDNDWSAWGGVGGSCSSTIGTMSSNFLDRTGEQEGTGVTFLLATNIKL